MSISRVNALLPLLMNEKPCERAVAVRRAILVNVLLSLNNLLTAAAADSVRIVIIAIQV